MENTLFTQQLASYYEITAMAKKITIKIMAIAAASLMTLSSAAYASEISGTLNSNTSNSGPSGSISGDVGNGTSGSITGDVGNGTSGSLTGDVGGSGGGGGGGGGGSGGGGGRGGGFIFLGGSNTGGGGTTNPSITYPAIASFPLAFGSNQPARSTSGTYRPKTTYKKSTSPRSYVAAGNVDTDYSNTTSYTATSTDDYLTATTTDTQVEAAPNLTANASDATSVGKTIGWILLALLLLALGYGAYRMYADRRTVRRR